MRPDLDFFFYRMTGIRCESGRQVRSVRPYIQKMVDAHNLAVPELLTCYSKKLHNLK